MHLSNLARITKHILRHAWLIAGPILQPFKQF